MVQAVNSARMVVAIDGPSGSGKSTVARGVAARLGFGYLDTGAMYRAVTWLVLREQLPLADLAEQTTRLAAVLGAAGLQIGTGPNDRDVTIAGQSVTEIIRGDEVTSAVSAVAAVPLVRAFLSDLQRQLCADAVATHGGVVVEGRDIGTAIFPDARLKVWLTASPEARGRRRAAEHSDGSTPKSATVQGVVDDLARRDALDSSRAASPLHCAPDAHVLDTTSVPADDVVAAVLALWDVIALPDAAARDSSSERHDSATGAHR